MKRQKMLQGQKLKIVIYNESEPDSVVLRQVAEPILDPTSKKVEQLVRNMLVTMYSSGGIGLAAPQVGQSLRLFVMDIGSDATRNFAFVNPVVLKSQGDFPSVEGCLSFPGKQVKKRRAKLIKIRAYEVLSKTEKVFKFRGLESACVQHEIDHLNGVLCIDVDRGQ